jgi:glutathione synthase/RimK-type ligase-like ATP-grasp enzyme
MATRNVQTPPLATRLNEACQCIWVDQEKLRRQLLADLGGESVLLETRAGLVSGSVVFVGPQDTAAMDRAIRVIAKALASDAFEARVIAQAPAIARAMPPATGGLLGFDFHLGGPVPQLIEINTNPGGLLVALELAKAATASCDCLASPLPKLAAASIELDQLPSRVVALFREEWRLARGDASQLSTVAIIDDDPQGQYLYPEFVLYRNLLERAGLRVLIADPADLEVRANALLCRGERVDLGYNRLTDFYLGAERHAALREAYERDLAVISPHPAAHARWADKRLLAWLRDESLLAAAGLDTSEQRTVMETIPPTAIVEPSQAAELWARRKELFFKPIDGYAGKAAYRGDKLTRTAFDHILAHRYVAQAIAPTSFRTIGVIEGEETELRVDVRNWAMHGETWLRAARLYRGQTTNFRTSGGGFAPVLTV